MEKKEQAMTTETPGAQGRIPILKTYKVYIDGKFPRTESGRYFQFKSSDEKWNANICHCSRKDFRDAVTAARGAFHKWSSATHYNRGQILYRIAEMLEGRRAQFIEELMHQGALLAEAQAEVSASIDRLVYYAGWSDKYQQVFSQVNPVSGPFFNFSSVEPMGVVAIMAPESSSLLGLVSVLAPVLVGGNTSVLLASSEKPLCAITFGEVLNSSDVPSGVVNILTGYRGELVNHFATHMDVNALFYVGDKAEERKALQEGATQNLKRVRLLDDSDWDKEDPYRILDFQETKTTWHPIGN